MPKVAINQKKCKGCLLCVNFCPRGLIKIDDQLNCLGARPAKFSGNKEQCIGCIQCAIICPECCIEVYK